jgi:hypothetical protein
LAIRSKKTMLGFGLFVGVLLTAPLALAGSGSGGRLVEDFSTDVFADYSATTGLWNLVDHVAQAGVVAAANAARPISFGDGSDGTLDTSGGFVFDTNSHPNGYNFREVNITSGTITVSGRNPLVIRSLTTLKIASSINLDGNFGANGTVNTLTTGPTGGSPIVGLAMGGSGGAANAVTASNGGDSLNFDGSVDLGNAGSPAVGADSSGANSVTNGPNATDFDVAGGFIGGSSGAGGGGNSNGGTFATGGAGGAGGGAVRFAAVGAVTLGAVTVRGGVGGIAFKANFCGGHGGGGAAGAIWVQTTKGFSTTSAFVDGGFGGISATCNGASVGGDGFPGQRRADRGDASTFPPVPPLPAFATETLNSTANAAPGQSYVIQSKGYDLDTLNANFATAPSITSVANGGSVSVQYAGSVDGGSYSGFTSDITTLSNQNYRYLKFKINMTTAGVAGPSPTISQIAIDYTDSGLQKLDLKLSPGCGVLSNHDSDKDNSAGPGAIVSGAWLMLWLLAFRLLKRPFRKT